MSNTLMIINDWQALIGSIIIGIITLGSVLIILYKIISEQKKKKKEPYNRLLAIIYELKMIIKRCEMYLNFQNEDPPKKSYNRMILHDFNNQVSQAQISDIHPKIYNSIKKIYSVSETIMHNFDKSEIINTLKGEIKDKKTILLKISEKDEINAQINKIDLQISDIGNRYGNAIAFIKCYLEDIYKNFNFICAEVWDYAKKNDFEFPNDIKRYTTKYVTKKIKDYKLELVKLDGY